MLIENLKNIRVKTSELDIPNLGTQEMADEKWAKLYETSKPVRDAVARGFLRAFNSPVKSESLEHSESKGKKSFKSSNQNKD